MKQLNNNIDSLQVAEQLMAEYNWFGFINREELAREIAADLESFGVSTLAPIGTTWEIAGHNVNSNAVVKNAFFHQVLKIVPELHSQHGNNFKSEVYDAVVLQPIREWAVQKYVSAAPERATHRMLQDADGRNLCVVDTQFNITKNYVDGLTLEPNHTAKDTQFEMRINGQLQPYNTVFVAEDRAYVQFFPLVKPFHDIPSMAKIAYMKDLKDVLHDIGFRLAGERYNGGVLLDARTGEIFRRNGKPVPVVLDDGDLNGEFNGKIFADLSPEIAERWQGAQQEAYPQYKNRLITAQVDEWDVLRRLSAKELSRDGLDPLVENKLVAFESELKRNGGSYARMLESRGYSVENHPPEYKPSSMTR